jgi:hypothetical protein
MNELRVIVTFDQKLQLLCAMSCHIANVGIASYMNVAITDPLSQTGVLAYDDEELREAIPTREIMTSSEHGHLHGNVFVVAFSRNCSGMRWCLLPQPLAITQFGLSPTIDTSAQMIWQKLKTDLVAWRWKQLMCAFTTTPHNEGVHHNHLSCRSCL